MKKQSFLYGAGILAVASLLCKIMSAALKIPLDRLFLHEEGIAVYQSAYSIYNVFLAVCVTGIPIALSSLIAKSDEKERAGLCKSTLVFVTLLMVVCAAFLIAFSAPLARLLAGGGEGVARLSLIVIAVALPFKGVISSRRGYFQGMGNMTPSAISQLTESLVKVFLGIGGCALLIKYGIAYGACGAIIGVSAGAICSAAVLEIFFGKNKTEKAQFSMKKALKVIEISIPMTLGAFGFTAVLLTDSLTVPELLASVGVEHTERLKMFGYLTRANTVYNLPATIITAFTASAVPSVAAAFAKNDLKNTAETSKRVIKLIFLVAVPCMLGMAFFRDDILVLLYGSASKSILLALAGAMVLIMPYIQTTTAMLQTMGKVWLPIIFTMSGVLVKLILNVFFVESFGVEGAVISTIAAFLVVFVLNSALLCRKTSLKGLFKPIVRIFICGIVSCGGAKLIYSFNRSIIMLGVCILFAAVVYVAGILLSGCIKKEEFFGE